jgi:hypothetical protein
MFRYTKYLGWEQHFLIKDTVKTVISISSKDTFSFPPIKYQRVAQTRLRKDRRNDIVRQKEHSALSKASFGYAS